MGRSFKLHAGIAAGASAVLLVLGALTWLPGILPLTGSAWPTAVITALLFPVFGAALLRMFLAGGTGTRCGWPFGVCPEGCGPG